MKTINFSGLIKYALFLTLVLSSYFSYVQTISDNVPSAEQIATTLEEALKNLPPNHEASVDYAIVVAPYNPLTGRPESDKQIELLCIFLSFVSAKEILNQIRKRCFIPVQKTIT